MSSTKEQRATEKWKQANREAQKRYRERHPDRVNARLRRWFAKNPQKAKEYRERRKDERHAYTKQWKMENPEKVLYRKRCYDLKKYNLSPEQYDEILVGQGGGCKLCGSTKAGGRARHLHVDHCHRTLIVRGLLCAKCNTAIGLLDDDPDRARAVAAYLEAARGGPANG
jgi:hypothetical protein